MKTKQTTETTARTTKPTSKKLRHPSGEQLTLNVRRGRGENRLKAERVQEELRAMTGWRLAPDGRSLHRHWEFPDARVASAHAAFVNDLSSDQGRAVAINLSGRRVLIVLRGSRRGGITEAMLGFAKVLG